MFLGMGLGMILCSVGMNAVVDTPAAHIEVLGDSRVRLEQAYGRLCAPPLNDADFVLSDVTFKYTRRFTEYSGDISGRMLGALNATEPLLGKHSPVLDALLAGLPPAQKEDGHFGAPQNLEKEVNQERDMPILWGNGRLLLALSERCKTAPDAPLLAVAKRLGDYVLSTHPYYGLKENFEKVGGHYSSGFTTCYPSLIDGLVALGELTQEPLYLEEARFIARLALIDKSFEGHHSHGRLVAYRGMLDLDRLSAIPEFKGPVLAGCTTLNQEFILPTGGVTELCDRAYARDEGCSEADWIRVNYLLWKASDDIRCLDIVEHAWGNHLLGTQLSNGGFGHSTFTATKLNGKAYPGGRIEGYVSDSYWCCSMHATQVLADLAHWGVLFEKDAVRITWLAEVRAQAPSGAYTVAVTQSAPGVWKVQLDSKEEQTIKLRLRLPGWADAITLDGKPCTVLQGWVDIPCTWTGSKTLEFQMPNTIRLEGPYGKNTRETEPVRVFAGSALYCLPEPLLTEDFLAKDAVPTVWMTDDAPNQAGIPVLVEGKNGREQQARLVPLAKRPLGACWVLFQVKKLEQAQFDKRAQKADPESKPGIPVEFMFSAEMPYACYVNGRFLFQGDGWQEAPRVSAYTRQEKTVIAVKVPVGKGHPGVIGQILTGTATIVTQPDAWQILACDSEPPAEWLTDMTQGADHALPVTDLGGFGAEPWKHTPAHFAGTATRWLWADTQNTQNTPHYLLIRKEVVAK